MIAIENKISSAVLSTVWGIINFYNKVGLPVVSTGRPFSFYRKVFFNNRSEPEVFECLKDKTVADIGCGLTPFIEDSMFQACIKQGIRFFGVDPKLDEELQFDKTDSMWSRIAGANHSPKLDLQVEDKAVGAYADQLPFGDESIDMILSSWLLFTWIREPDLLADIFTEFDRTLKPGGRISIYPALDWETLTSDYPRLLSIFSGYQHRHEFFPLVRSGGLPFSCSLHLTKK